MGNRPYTTPKKKVDWRAHLTVADLRALRRYDIVKSLLRQFADERSRIIARATERARKAEGKP